MKVEDVPSDFVNVNTLEPPSALEVVVCEPPVSTCVPFVTVRARPLPLTLVTTLPVPVTERLV